MINIDKIDEIAKLYIEKLILVSDPAYPQWNRENFIFSKPGKWNYMDACIIKAVTMLYELSGDERLFDYAQRFVDAYIGDYGDIPSMNCGDYNLDNINGGKNLIYLYKKTHRAKYHLAFEWLYNEQLLSQPRLRCGNFTHKAIYPSQIWLDGAYMSLPFLAEYAVLCGDTDISDDVCRQIKIIVSIMRNADTGLYYHGYDETKSMNWADKNTGLSREFWLRSIGWLCAALADICEIADDFHELHDIACCALRDLIDAMSQYITDENMLNQLPTRGDDERNYPETSGTLLFSYAALKSYRLGITGEKAKTDGLRTLSAVLEN